MEYTYTKKIIVYLKFKYSGCPIYYLSSLIPALIGGSGHCTEPIPELRKGG